MRLPHPDAAGEHGGPEAGGGRVGRRRRGGGGILGWLVGRVAGAESDSNRTYASEILAILLQSSDKNKKSFLRLEGVESLLQSIAKFRKVAPRDAEEEEYLGEPL